MSLSLDCCSTRKEPLSQLPPLHHKAAYGQEKKWAYRPFGTAAVDITNSVVNPQSSTVWSQPSVFTHGKRLPGDGKYKEQRQELNRSRASPAEPAVEKPPRPPNIE